MEKVVLTTEGTPLIKFQKLDRIKSLQKGHLYANTLEYYRKLEEMTGDNEIGDSYEGMAHIAEGSLVIPSTGEKISLNNTFFKTDNSNDYVFCMFGTYPSIEYFEFTPDQKEKMLSFGDAALIIYKKDEFVNRVCKAAQEKGYKANFGAVEYYDSSETNGNMFISLLNGMWNIALWKRDIYKYQQEARFIFSDGDKTKDHLELEIGDISDISIIVPAEQALTGIMQMKK